MSISLIVMLSLNVRFVRCGFWSSLVLVYVCGLMSCDVVYLLVCFFCCVWIVEVVVGLCLRCVWLSL